MGAELCGSFWLIQEKDYHRVILVIISGARFYLRIQIRKNQGGNSEEEHLYASVHVCVCRLHV